jgi:hypothetical protein
MRIAALIAAIRATHNLSDTGILQGTQFLEARQLSLLFYAMPVACSMPKVTKAYLLATCGLAATVKFSVGHPVMANS